MIGRNTLSTLVVNKKHILTASHLQRILSEMNKNHTKVIYNLKTLIIAIDVAKILDMQ